MIRLAVLTLLFGLTALAPGAALGQEATSDVTYQVQVLPEDELTVGDPVEIRISLIHEAQARVLMDGSVVQMGGMEPSAPVISNLSDTETLVVFQTRAFRAGLFEVELPAIPVLEADQALTEVHLNPLTIAITSVLNAESEPRPLSGPDLLEGESRTFAPWIVAIIGIGLGFVLARLARRWRVRQLAAEGPQAAQQAIVERSSFEMDPSLEAAEQCRQLAASVRARLGSDWSLPASALTSSEIGPALAAAGAPGVVVLRVTRLLEACDRVQFGGEQPTPERLSGYRQLAEAIWADGDSIGDAT